MSLISKETWEKHIPQEEKEKILKRYDYLIGQYFIKNSIYKLDHEVFEDIFGEEILQEHWPIEHDK